MAVIPSDLVFYGSQNMPDVDGATVGGAIDLTTRVFFADIITSGTLEYVSSSSSDTTVSIAVTYTDPYTTGVFTETNTLTGVVPLAGTAKVGRILKGAVTGVAVGDVAAISSTPIATGAAQGAAAVVAASNGVRAVPARLRLASGQVAAKNIQAGMIVRITNNTPVGVQNQLRYIVGVGKSVDPATNADDVYLNRDWDTVPSSSTSYSIHTGLLFENAPNQITKLRHCFYNVPFNNSSSFDYFSKIFIRNNNSTTTLHNVRIAVNATDWFMRFGSLLSIQLAPSLNDNATTTDRKTAPAGITFNNVDSTNNDSTRKNMFGYNGVTYEFPHDHTPSLTTNLSIAPGSAQGIWLDWYVQSQHLDYVGWYQVTVTGTTGL